MLFMKFLESDEFPCLDPYLDHWCIVGETNCYDVPKPGTISPLEIDKT